MPVDAESIPTKSSLLSWSPSTSSGVSLADFLSKHDPSKTRTPAGGDGWIWVTNDEADGRRGKVKEEAVEKGKELLKALVDRLEAIKNDSAIPTRKSKTSGPTKADLKQQAISKAKKDLEATAVESGWTCGKWLFFENSGYVAWVFSRLATSLISGPLSKLKARPHTIKVSTTDGDAMGHNSKGEDKHIICLYFDNVWNEDDAKEVLTCILREHGDKPSAAKSDFYTLLDIMSKHPSGLRSSQWQPGELINPSIIEEWVTEGREKRKAEAAEKRGESPGKQKARRTVADDAFEDFESDRLRTTSAELRELEKEREREAEKSGETPSNKAAAAAIERAAKAQPGAKSKPGTQAQPATKPEPAAKPKPAPKDEDSDTEDDDEPVLISSSSSTTRAKPAPAAALAASSSDDSSDKKNLPNALAGSKRSAPSSSSGENESVKPPPAQRKKIDKYGRGAF